MMPVGTEDGFSTMVDIESSMVDHTFEAEFLHRVPLAVHPWPLALLYSLLDFWGAPIDQGLVLGGLDNHKVSWIILTALFPRSAIDLAPIVEGLHLGGLEAPETCMFVIIEHAQQAQVVVVKRLGQGHGIDRPVDDKHDATDAFRHLLTVGHYDVRHMDVGRIIGHKDRLPGVIMGNHGLRARHDTTQHRDLGLMHGAPAPVGHQVTIVISAWPCLGG